MAAVTLQLTNDTRELAQLTAGLTSFCADQAVPAELQNTMRLALEEVVTNVIHHGCNPETRHTINVHLAWENEEFTARVADDGRPFDPLLQTEPDINLPIEDRPIGGLGVHMVRHLMDGLEYRWENGKNILIMKKR